MEKKQIVIQIDEVGNLTAETFNMHGVECSEKIDKLMKGLATLTKSNKKEEYFNEGNTLNKNIKTKTNG